jgi:predicted TIM-barrel fold metal-dependent hydrolase
MIGRVDTHQHLIPDFYRRELAAAGLHEAGGRELPDWSVDRAIELMDLVGTRTAIVAVSTPGVSFVEPADRAASLARELNDYAAALPAERAGRFGFFATLPMPDITASVAEAERALDDLRADGVVLAPSPGGIYLGAAGHEPLFKTLNERRTVVFIHPGELPGQTVYGVTPFAADFLLDTTRAAYLLVRNGIVRRYPNLRFILSHAGGFVPYAAHRLAVTITAETGRTPLDALEDLQSFYFDTALSSSPAALPTLLAFALPGHVLFGSDWPFAPRQAVQYFANGLDQYDLDPATRSAIERGNAHRLFPRLATEPVPPLPDPTRTIVARRAIQRTVARVAFKLVQPR